MSCLRQNFKRPREDWELIPDENEITAELITAQLARMYAALSETYLAPSIDGKRCFK